jgi:hypothetical protein
MPGFSQSYIRWLHRASSRGTPTRLARLIDCGLVREIDTIAKDPQRKHLLVKGGLPLPPGGSALIQ